MESKASKTAELQILAIRDFLSRDGHGRAWGGGGGEGGTKTQRRRKETGAGGGAFGTVRNGRDNGQRADTKPKIK
jgi:hypothetical protein